MPPASSSSSLRWIGIARHKRHRHFIFRRKRESQERLPILFKYPTAPAAHACSWGSASQQNVCDFHGPEQNSCRKRPLQSGLCAVAPTAILLQQEKTYSYPVCITLAFQNKFCIIVYISILFRNYYIRLAADYL